MPRLQGAGVPLGFRYLPCKAGPSSLDLRSELATLRSGGFLAVAGDAYPHGPQLTTTIRALSLSTQFAATLRKYRADVARAADVVAGTDSAAVESLVRPFLLQETVVDDGDLVQTLQRLRPGLHWKEAAAAIRAVRRELGP